jgi:peptidoglycan-N-acetylglucosamine deacetylase
MSQPPRLETRKRKRRNSAAATYGVLLALVVVAAAAGWLGWSAISRSHDHKAAYEASAASQAPSGAPAAAPTPAAPSGSVATRTAAVEATGASIPDPSAEKRASASQDAVARAAVRFPGAPELSSSTRSISQLHPRHKYVALTLDDGYNFQPQMLELLKQYDAHCTTFVIGSWAASHKSDLKLMKNAGFEIANHSWSHPQLTKISSAGVASELTRTQKIISSVTGNQAPYLRPPFGATDNSVKATAAGLGYRIVMWSRTFGDSGRGATPKKLYANVMTSNGGIQPGDIILCHWGSKPSYEALKKILPELKAQGYELVTVSELIADSKK